METKIKNPKTRQEHDSIGTKDVPAEAYYGVQTIRAAENFYITGMNMHPELINSVPVSITMQRPASIFVSIFMEFHTDSG